MAGMSVEAALQEVQETLDVERSEAQKRLQAAQLAQNQEPYLTELQNDHPCCNCGTIIPCDKPTVCCTLPLSIGQFLTNQFITWCDRCWSEHFGSLGKVKDMTPSRYKS